MIGNTDRVPKDNNTINHEGIFLESHDELQGESSTVLKSKIKHDCDSRKRLEKKLEEVCLRKQIQDYDFDDLD
jgi:hypothetical protein